MPSESIKHNQHLSYTEYLAWLVGMDLMADIGRHCTDGNDKRRLALQVERLLMSNDPTDYPIELEHSDHQRVESTINTCKTFVESVIRKEERKSKDFCKVNGVPDLYLGEYFG